jgi:hypothetical protein
MIVKQLKPFSARIQSAMDIFEINVDIPASPASLLASRGVYYFWSDIGVTKLFQRSKHI